MYLPNYQGSIVFKTAGSTYTSTSNPIRKIQVLVAATFTTLTDTSSTTDGNATQSVAADYGTVPVGTILEGTFTTVTLAGGVVKAYY